MPYLFLVFAPLLACSSAPPLFHPAPLLLQKPTLELVESRKIWDAAPHNAFTDLTRFRDRWVCTFREGKAHVSPDGAVRVITSADGAKWESAALLRSEAGDLRDSKLSITPDGRLMLSAASALHKPTDFKHQSLSWLSADGTDWGEPAKVADPGYWLWRVTWHKDAAYGVGYHTGTPPQVRLYRTVNGRAFEPLAVMVAGQDYPNEATIRFQPDGTALCLLRREKGTATGLIGTSKAPYSDWAWKDLGVRIGGPNFIRLPDGRLLAAVRLYDGKVRTALCWLDIDAGKLTEALTLPSGGDNSYAGLVWHDGLLWVSYYSSHEGKTSIYLAKVRVGS
jgi:hypothetical protein